MAVRRRYLTAAQRDLRAYKKSAPISIGELAEERREREHREEVAHRQAVRERIWRTRFSCQVCHGARRAECAGFDDEMHEDPSRAMTRGQPLAERFNLRVCGRLCKACHTDVTEHRLRLVFEDPVERFLRGVTAVLVL